MNKNKIFNFFIFMNLMGPIVDKKNNIQKYNSNKYNNELINSTNIKKINNNRIIDKDINNKNNNNFIELLKKHTDIDIYFIDTFIKKNYALYFHIKDIDVVEYLNITLDNIRRRLQNKYSKVKKFIENVDFIKIKAGKPTGVIYIIN